MFASLQAENISNHPARTQSLQRGVCMPLPTTSVIQKPSFSNIEIGLKFLPSQAIAIASLSPSPLYHEWPRQHVPRNGTDFSFEHRASFHGRG